ncbi:uncharacterized protein LOC123526265 [Mercenaria mercenaria]|uniref:uncharacterized protein LOC123526265 n=1 Tax=Mercenaria mercenaria TaxID=6596 RepID=UPI00234E3958|nr:uncharacterized protein LOC123526265 [Mercenaria mercenaria]
MSIFRKVTKRLINMQKRRTLAWVLLFFAIIGFILLAYRGLNIGATLNKFDRKPKDRAQVVKHYNNGYEVKTYSNGKSFKQYGNGDSVKFYSAGDRGKQYGTGESVKQYGNR